MTGDSSSILGEKRSAELSVIALDQQIADHKKTDEGKSVLGWAVSQIWGGDRGSLSRLEQLSKDAHEAQAKGDTTRLQQLSKDITTAVTSDQDSLHLHGEITHYSTTGLKTAALFFGGGKAGMLENRGMIGLATTVGLYGLDEAKMGDNATTFATNFALGGAKGGLTKAMFQQMGNLPIESTAGKGIIMGIGSRFIDTSLTAANYRDANGNFDLSAGLGKTISTVADTRAMVMDAALFTAAHGLTRGANWMTGGAIDARPIYNTIGTSASFGLSNGAYSEYSRQLAEGENLDYGKIVTRALIQGGVDAIAGVPGGLNADANFRKRPLESIKEDASAVARRFSFLNESGLQATANKMFGGGERSGAVEPLPKGEQYVRKATDGDGHGDAHGESHGAGDPHGGLLPFGVGDHSGSHGSPYAAAHVEGGKEVSSVKVKPATTVMRTGIVDNMDRVVAPTAAKEVVPPTVATAEKLLGTGEKVEAVEAGKKAERVAETRVYTPEQIAAANKALDEKLAAIKGREPTFDQSRDIVEFLRNHPEGDNHAATLYVRNFSNPAMRRAIEGFYKPGYAMQNEAALATPPVREAYEKFDIAMRDPVNRGVLPHILGGYVKNMLRRAGVNTAELTEVVSHHGRTTYDVVAAKAIDYALGTKYAENMDLNPAHDRNLPLTEKDIEYVRALALGKPLPGGPTRVALETSATEGVWGPESGIKSFAATEEGRTEAKTGSGGTMRVDELIREANAGLAQQIAKDAELLRTGTEGEKLDAAHKLADQLGHDSAAGWFADWVKVAPNTHISAVGELANPLVQDLVAKAPDAVRQFLANDPSGLPLSYRFRALSEIATAFEGKPGVAEQVVRIGAGDPNAMRNIGYELTRGFARQQYADWLANAVAPKEGVTAPTAEEISGESAVRKARISSAFGDTPVARYLEQFAQFNPEAAEQLIRKLPRPDQPAEKGRGGPPKAPRGTDMQELLTKVIEKRIAAGVAPEALPEQLSPDLLNMELRLNKAFSKNPAALEPLLNFARSHLTEVADLLEMPMTPEQQRVAKMKAPRGAGRPDMNDPNVRAQKDLQRLSFAYSDMIGIMAPKVAELPPAEALAQLKAIQNAFSDALIKNFAANMHTDKPEMRTNADAAERELNRLSDRFLPDNEVLRRDAQLRREAIAKGDANLLPMGPPPDIAKLERDAARAKPTEKVVTPPEEAVVAPTVVEPTEVVETATSGKGTGAGTVAEVVAAGEPVVQPAPKSLDEATARAAKPRVMRSFAELANANIVAEETARQEEWARRKGRNNEYEDGEDGGGRGRNSGKKGRQGRPKDWRRANEEDGDDY